MEEESVLGKRRGGCGLLLAVWSAYATMTSIDIGVAKDVPAVSKRNVMEFPAVAVFCTDTVSWPIWL